MSNATDFRFFVGFVIFDIESHLRFPRLTPSRRRRLGDERRSRTTLGKSEGSLKSTCKLGGTPRGTKGVFSVNCVGPQIHAHRNRY